MDGGARFRILSLDGGGVWALIEVRALMRLYGDDTRGHDVLGRFDLIAGNSAGSLVLAGLLENMKLSEVLHLFLDEASRRRLFARRAWYAYLNPLNLILNRYSTARKLAALRDLLPRTRDLPLDALRGTLGGRKPHIILMGFDYDRERAVFFRSNLGSRASNFAPYTPPPLALAAAASSDAPIRYFDRPVSIPDPPNPDRRYWDGGVGGYNNPVLAAVIEAIADGAPAARIDALSLGTALMMRPRADAVSAPELTEPRATQWIGGDIKKFAGAILDEPPDAATFIAHVALGARLPTGPNDPVADGALVRMNPLLQPVRIAGEWALPTGTSFSLKMFDALSKVTMDTVAPADIDLIDRFAFEWLDDIFPNQPIRAGKDFACEIGHPRFGAAQAAWQARAGR